MLQPLLLLLQLMLPGVWNKNKLSNLLLLQMLLLLSIVRVSHHHFMFYASFREDYH